MIAIIGILASLLLPAIASVRRRADAARCLSNLRQIGVAATVYCNDNGDYLPYAWINNPDARVNSFHSLLQPLLNATPFDGYGDFERCVFPCNTRTHEPLVGANTFRVSYAMNAFNAMSYPGELTLKLAAVKDPVNTVLAADVACGLNHPAIQNGGAAQVGYKHAGTANFLFMDGHVANLRPDATGNLIFSF